METVTVCYFIEECDDSLNANIDEIYCNSGIPNAFQLIVPPTHNGTENFHDNYYEVLLLDIVRFLQHYTCGDGTGLPAMDPFQFSFYLLVPSKNTQSQGQFQCISIPSLATCLCHSNQPAWRTQHQPTVQLLLRRGGKGPGAHPLNLLEYFYRQLPRPLPRPPRQPQHQSQQQPQSHPQSQQQHERPKLRVEEARTEFDPFAVSSNQNHAQRRTMSSSGSATGSDTGTGAGSGRPASTAATMNAAAATGQALFSSFLGTVNSAAQSTLSSVVAGTAGLGAGLVGGGSGLGGLGGLQLTQNGTTVQIDRELAEGGFSTVYLAHRQGDGQGATGPQQYALKQVRCQTSESVRAASNELAALQRFHHPHIIRLLDSAVQDGRHQSGSGSGLLCTHWYLLPLFAHGSAWDAVERFMNYTGTALPNRTPKTWPFPEPIALEIMVGVTSALATIHQAGFCHRDVKPHNVLLRPSTRGAGRLHPVLMDLGSMTAARTAPISSKGLANEIEEEANSNTSPAYKPPELVAVPYNAYTYAQVAPGDSNPNPRIVLDERVDIWSLGCVMFALAFGMSPFESLSEGVKKLGILNASYTVPASNLSPPPPKPTSGSGSGSGNDWADSPLTMPPPLPTRRGPGTGTGSKSLERPASAQPCQAQFSSEYVATIAAMLKLNFNDRPFADVIRSRCEQLLRQQGVEL